MLIELFNALTTCQTQNAIDVQSLVGKDACGCLYLLGLSDADISALMQRAYTTVNDRGRKMKAIFGTEEPLSTTLRSFAEESTSN